MYSLKSNIFTKGRFLLIAYFGLASIIFMNVEFDENKDLSSHYRSGHYKNFEKIRIDDPLFIELRRTLRCEDYRNRGIYRVDISSFKFFVIETSEYLEVRVAPKASGQCISEVTFRRYP